MSPSKRPAEDLYQAVRAGDRRAYEELYEEMKDLARRIARRFADQASESELLPVAMTYFDFALKEYNERRDRAALEGKDFYKFSTYFTRWMRESIKTYLGISKSPLKRIGQRRP